jgi:hypothetical protein
MTIKKEVHTIIEKRPGDLPHESHSASRYFDSYTEAKAFLDKWVKEDKRIGKTHSISSVDL